MKISYEVQELEYPEQNGAVKQGWQWLIGEQCNVTLILECVDMLKYTSEFGRIARLAMD